MFFHRLRYRTGSRRLELAVVFRRKEDRRLAERLREVVVDRGDQFRDGETGGKTPRKIIEVMDVPLALAQRLGFLAQARGEIAADERHPEEQQQVDDFLRILNLETEDRRKEKEIRFRHADDGSQRRRPDSPSGGSDDDGNEIGDRDEAGGGRLLQQQQQRRDQTDAADRQQQRDNIRLQTSRRG